MHENAAGGPSRHVPVLLREVLDTLDTLEPRDGGVFVDGTFGLGGYTTAILEAGAGSVLAIDRDPNAIRDGQALVDRFSGKLQLVMGRFGDLDALVDEQLGGFVDGVVLDIGVSSMQLDEAERGFSFRYDGPLDMRMEQAGPSAEDVVNELGEADLARVLYIFGEEKKSRRIAKAIVEARKAERITRTSTLASLVEKTIGRGMRDKIHPATRTFQALRIYVNGELDELGRALLAAERVLKPGGRLVVVTFHSLEDRIVKRFFTERSKTHGGGSRHRPEQDLPDATFTLKTRKALSPQDDEIAENPRARSSRLRAAVRTDAPSRHSDQTAWGVPDLVMGKGG